MRKSLFLLLATATVLTGCGQKFHVNGTLDGAKFPAADTVAIVYEMMPAPIQAAVKDDAFKMAGKLKKPIIAKLNTVGTERRNTRVFILEKGNITFKDGLAVGTPLNDSTYAFSRRVVDLAKQYAGDPSGRKEAINKEFSDFVSRHKNDPCAVYAILYGNRRLSPLFLRELIKSTSPEIQNDGEVHGLNALLERLPM